MKTIDLEVVGTIPPCDGGDNHTYQLTYWRRWYIGRQIFVLRCWDCNLRLDVR